MVSDSTADYAEKIIPALKYCNYVIINDIEYCKIYDLNPNEKEDIKTAMRNMAECGVGGKVIVHSKSVSFWLDVKSGEFTECPSLNIPKEESKDSGGAGDAFCLDIGCLFHVLGVEMTADYPL